MIKPNSRSRLNEICYAPIVSIIILSLSRISETLKCLRSVLANTKSPYEIIVVDMGTSRAITSKLKKIAARHNNIRVIFNKTNLGVARGRNRGVEIAKGKYIVFLDNDARVTGGWLDPLIDTVNKSKSIGACGAKILFPDDSVQYCSAQIACSKQNDRLKTIGVRRNAVIAESSAPANRPGEVFWYPTTCLLAKKDALKKIGGFDENFLRAEEDKDLCLSLRKKGYKIAYSPRAKVYHNDKSTDRVYDAIRHDMGTILRDVGYFEKKWRCKTVNTISSGYLKKTGYSEKQIKDVFKFDFLTEITGR